ncbi:MAG: limonene,2-epoxide hydrolase [Solirubrobacteraceae bacterium]|jgi:limonene-1,2-epoxide hydrolase|nr:limonene,2-epoxide hydrolase [Solirubrobacteraceae bacterium]
MATTTSVNGTATAPAAVVRAFLEGLEAGDLDGALDLLADDAVWINVSLPTARGRKRIESLIRLGFGRLGMRFRVHFHHVATDVDVVLTERTDAIGIGPFEQRFWVTGRFEVRDGKIVVWRDYFDYVDYTVSILRGLAGMLSSRLNRPWPAQH